PAAGGRVGAVTAAVMRRLRPPFPPATHLQSSTASARCSTTSTTRSTKPASSWASRRPAPAEEAEQMEIPRADFEIVQGDGVEIPMQLLAAGAPVDFTGYTGACQARKRAGATGDPELELAVDLGDEGSITLTATGAQTGAVAAGKLAYDLKLTAGADDP